MHVPAGSFRSSKHDLTWLLDCLMIKILNKKPNAFVKLYFGFKPFYRKRLCG